MVYNPAPCGCPGWGTGPKRYSGDPIMTERSRTQRWPTRLISAFAWFVLVACTPKESFMDETQLKNFATRYTAAWCSQDAARVAAFFAEGASLQINDGKPAMAEGYRRTDVTAL